MDTGSGLGAFYLSSHPGSGRPSAGGPLVVLREGATVGLPFFSLREHYTYREDSDSCRQDSVREKAWPLREKIVSFSLVTAQCRPAVLLHSHTGIQIPALLSLYPPQGQGVVSRCGSQTSSISSPPPRNLVEMQILRHHPIPTESESRAGAQLLVSKSPPGDSNVP